jgi:hypothetical protein
LELETEATGKCNNANKGVANLRISKEKQVVEVAMEVQVESLEVTISIFEKIDILIKRTKENVHAKWVNTNEEQTKEEVVVTRTK